MSKELQKELNRKLFEAIKDADVKQIEELTEDGADVNIVDGQGNTLLHIGIKQK